MYNNFFGYPNGNNQPPQNTHEMFKIRNVSSFDEAKNMNIDYLNTYVCLDLNNSNIYLKRLNNNGFEEIFTFRLTENPPDKIQLMEQRMSNIENLLERVFNNANEPNDVQSNGGASETAKSSSIPKSNGNASRKN